jgi:hypothetical protein
VSQSIIITIGGAPRPKIRKAGKGRVHEWEEMPESTTFLLDGMFVVEEMKLEG